MIKSTVVVTDFGFARTEGDRQIDDEAARNQHSEWVKVLVPKRHEAALLLALETAIKAEKGK